MAIPSLGETERRFSVPVYTTQAARLYESYDLSNLRFVGSTTGVTAVYNESSPLNTQFLKLMDNFAKNNTIKVNVGRLKIDDATNRFLGERHVYAAPAVLIFDVKNGVRECFAVQDIYKKVLDEKRFMEFLEDEVRLVREGTHEKRYQKDANFFMD